MRMTLSAVAERLRGDVLGQQVVCPGPGHSAKDRSLSVRFSATAPEGFVCHSYAGDDPLQCRDDVRARLGWDRPLRFGSDQDAPRIAKAAPNDQNVKIENARRIWSEARDPSGTLVDTYLASRGLTLPAEARREAIRFHPRCPWRDKPSGKTIFVPAMVGALRAIADEQIVGIHRTRLANDGRKVDRRMLGQASGAAVMLCPFSAVGAGVTIGEGIETCLSASQIGWSNTWALGSVSAIAAFPVLAGIQALTVLTETGDGGANARATATVAARYEAAGREAYAMSPRRGDDLNDAILRRRA